MNKLIISTDFVNERTLKTTTYSHLLKRSFLFVFLFFIFSQMPVRGQQTRPFRVGVGLAIGFFYPQDVNDYIANDLPSSYQTSWGTTEMFLNLGLNLNLCYKANKHLEFQWPIEGAIAPKYIFGDVTYSYNFWRVSTGPIVNFHIPTSESGKHSFFIGAGPMMHLMGFKSFGGVNIGIRGQIGFSLSNFKLNPQVFISGDYANVKDGLINLNYSGVRIGCNLNF